MKTNFIIGKKQIVLASLVLVLGVAVYLNWMFANTNDQLEATNKLQDNVEKISAEDTGIILDEIGEGGVAVDPVDASVPPPANVTEDENTKTKNLGDAQLVNAMNVTDDTYFVKAKLFRTKSRDEAIQTIATILDDDKLTEADKKDATQKAMAITDIIEAESRLENLIKAKGYSECMVYMTSESASIVVKTPGLDQNQATQIKNIAVSEGKVKGENVSITEIK